MVLSNHDNDRSRRAKFTCANRTNGNYSHYLRSRIISCDKITAAEYILLRIILPENRSRDSVNKIVGSEQISRRIVFECHVYIIVFRCCTGSKSLLPTWLSVDSDETSVLTSPEADLKRRIPRDSRNCCVTTCGSSHATRSIGKTSRTVFVEQINNRPPPCVSNRK